MSIHNNIKDWRWRIVRAGYTQASFCAELNISRAAMSEYLSGKKHPSIQTFNKIESALERLGV